MWIALVVLIHFHNVYSMPFCSMFVYCDHHQLQHYATDKWYVENYNPLFSVKSLTRTPAVAEKEPVVLTYL